MGFSSGSVSFRRFAVIGEAPARPDQELLDRLSQHALRPSELGLPEEVEYGWCGGRHVLDGQFSFEHNVFADAVAFALRVDTNKVPGSLKKAYTLMEEEAVAATNPSGFISKQQKRDVRDVVRRKLDDELRSGRFRRSRMLPVLWDLPSQTVYCQATGKSAEMLMEIFERSFGVALEPVTSGSLALRLMERHGRRRDYEDSRPTRFVPGPEGEGQYPEYPWVAKGPQPKDFLGNELLLWLWHQVDARGGTIATDSAGDVSVVIDKSLDLDCAYGQTGRDSLRADGAVRMPEAKDALRSGKLPRKAWLIVHTAGHQFELTLNPEALAVGAARLPEVEEADTDRVLFEERIAMLRDLCKGLDALYERFLTVRCSSGWEGAVGSIRRWILTSAPKPVAAVA